MRSTGHICQQADCDKPAATFAGNLLCGAHWHRVPYHRREQLKNLRPQENRWAELEAAQRLAVEEVDALEGVPAAA